MNTQLKSTVVFCTLQVDGVHNWPDCPLEEVAFLRDLHRHTFHIKAEIRVDHANRAVEFIVLKHKILSYLHARYFNETLQCHHFDDMSCEMIASELCSQFDLSSCEVNEDNECGAIVTVEGIV